MHCTLDERSTGRYHGLKVLTEKYFDISNFSDAIIKKYLPNTKASYTNVPPEILGKYAGMDTDYTRRLYFVLKNELAEEPTLERI